jgi:hypothetical protein
MVTSQHDAVSVCQRARGKEKDFFIECYQFNTAELSESLSDGVSEQRLSEESRRGFT